MEDISSGKKPYKKIIHPLILYISRLFKELTTGQQENYRIYLVNKYYHVYFYGYLGWLCLQNGQFDLAFEYFRVEDLVKFISKVENRVELFNFFKENPHLAIQYQTALTGKLVVTVSEILNWIGECIIYDVPEEIYFVLLSPDLLKKLIEYEWFLSLNIPESEYPRIHFQIRKLLGDLNEQFYNIINDIRFGLISHDINYFNFSSFDDKQLLIIAKAALMGNKAEIFIEAFHHDHMNQIIKMANSNNLNMNSYKLIFQVFASIKIKIPESKNYFELILKFYAIKQMKSEKNYIYLEFVALEDLIDLGFPRVIRTKLEDLRWFIDDLFLYIKVGDEKTLKPFLNDYKKYLNLRGKIYSPGSSVSIEFLELISKSQSLIDTFISLDIRLWLKPSDANVKRYLDIENLEEISRIVGKINFNPRFITRLTNEEQLKKIKTIQQGTISEYFSNLKLSRTVSDCDYFQWRLAFNYWIKKEEQNNWIMEIKSPDIVEMLKLEFPEEMSRLQKHKISA